MKLSFVLSCILALLVSSSEALGLIETLQLIGASQFAAYLSSDPSLLQFFTSSAVRTVFAPIDGSAMPNFGLWKRATATQDAALQASALQNDMTTTAAKRRLKRGAATCAAPNVRDAPIETYLRQHTIGNQSVVPDCDVGAAYKLLRRGEDHFYGKPTITSEKPSTTSCATSRPTGTVIPGLELTAGLGIRVDVLEADIPYDNGLIQLMAEWFTVPQSVSETLKEVGLSSFLDLICKAKLLDSLNALSGITIFAPTNGALADAELISDPKELEEFIYSHVVPDKVLFHPLLTDGLRLRTLAGTELVVSLKDGEIYINDAKIVVYDYITDNGVIHSIDKPLAECAKGKDDDEHTW